MTAARRLEIIRKEPEPFELFRLPQRYLNVGANEGRNLQSAKIENQLRPVLTVSQLTMQIRDVLEELFDNVYVVGEVSNAKVYPSGHWYFSLKDKDATLPCVCFKSANSAIKFKLEDGLMVVAKGKLSLYPPKGAYQMVAAQLEPVGIGEWQLAFEQLKTALEKEGLLEAERKRPIPIFPRRVGVVTSTAGAALRDILTALYRRNRNVNVVIAPTRVQGEGSAEEVAQAIVDIQQIRDLDVVIVARGGGSIEDLWSFNTEVVARAVAACRVPIVSGVGHETDITICDLVADLRAPTPTAAAELVAKGSQELFQKYKHLEQKLVFNTQNRLAKVRRQLERLNPENALRRYQDRLHRHRLTIAHLKKTIDRVILNLIFNRQQQLRQHHANLLALAPLQVLTRGYAILQKMDGSVVRDASEVDAGEELRALLMNGSLKVRVEAASDADHFAAVPNLPMDFPAEPGEDSNSLNAVITSTSTLVTTVSTLTISNQLIDSDSELDLHSVPSKSHLPNNRHLRERPKSAAHQLQLFGQINDDQSYESEV